MTEKTQGAKVSRVYRTKGPPKGNGVSETKAAFNYRSILGYCLGAIGGVCSYNFLSNYGNFYFTDVLKIANSAVVVIMLVVRIFDAAFAPLMGVMIDKFTSRWGRMRHWWLIGSIAVPVVFSFASDAASDQRNYQNSLLYDHISSVERRLYHGEHTGAAFSERVFHAAIRSA